MKEDVIKLQVRMDRRLKDEAEAVFAEMGLDTTTAVGVFFTEVAGTGQLPFALTVDTEFTAAQEERISKFAEESRRSTNLSGPSDSPEKLFSHLDGTTDTQITS